MNPVRNSSLAHSFSLPVLQGKSVVDGVAPDDAAKSRASADAPGTSQPPNTGANSHSGKQRKLSDGGEERRMRNKMKAVGVKMTPSSYQCRLFCGGMKCKYCRYDCWPKEDMAVQGLYSHWVTDELLAMARPTTAAIEKYELVDQFIEQGISSIVNLQHAGEHKWCAELLPAGFSYSAEAFMQKGIFHYNFGWPDFGVSPLATILDMVKVLSFALTQGRCAVHCHAGLGRTGVLIACYMLWARRMHPVEAITYVRRKRPNSIQTAEQTELVHKFCDFLHPIRLVFNPDVDFLAYVELQRHALHGVEARVLKHLPKIVYVLVERLSELFGKARPGSLRRKLDMLASGDDLVPVPDPFYENLAPHAFDANKSKQIRENTVHDNPNTMRMIRQLSVDVVAKSIDGEKTAASRGHITSCGAQQSTETDADTSASKPSRVRSTRSSGGSGGSTSSQHNRGADRLPPIPDADTESPMHSPSASGEPGPDSTANSANSAGCSWSPVAQPHADWTAALKAALTRYLPSAIEGQVLTYERSMQQFSGCWDQLAAENNSLLLLALLGKWFHSFKGPCVPLEVLMPLEAPTGSPSAGARHHKMQPAQKWTILYCANTMSSWCGGRPTEMRDAAVLLCDWFTRCQSQTL